MSSTTVDTSRRSVGPLRTLTSLHWLGIVLATSTGAIHLWLGLAGGKAGMIVAGAGFAVGVAAVLANVRRAAFVRIGLSFTGGQIILYALAHGLFKLDAPTFEPVGVIDKGLQIALVVSLFAIQRRE